MDRVPGGVKFLAALVFLGSISCCYFGYLSCSASSGVEHWLATFGRWAGAFLLVWGAVGVLIGRGLWLGRQWARVLMILSTAVAIVLGVLSFSFSLSSIGGIVLNVAIFWYLAFNPRVRAAFRR